MDLTFTYENMNGSIGRVRFEYGSHRLFLSRYYFIHLFLTLFLFKKTYTFDGM